MTNNLMYKVFAMGAFLLFACSGDDGTSYKEEDLIRKWYNISAGNPTGCGKDYFEYTQTHAYRGVHWVISPSGPSGGNCVATDGIGNPYGQSWALSGNKITITFGPHGGTAVYTIKTLTADKLIIESENGSGYSYTANE